MLSEISPLNIAAGDSERKPYPLMNLLKRTANLQGHLEEEFLRQVHQTCIHFRIVRDITIF